MINSTSLDKFDNNEYQIHCSAAQLEKDLNILKGIMAGINSDHNVNTQEIALIKDWIDDARAFERYYPYRVFIDNLRKVIADNVITEEEIQDINWLCEQYLNKDNPYYCAITSATQTLTGILSGITADGEINEEEIDFLNHWLDEHLFLRKTWLFDEIYRVTKEIVFTRHLSPNLLAEIQKITNMVASDLGNTDNSKLIENIKLDTDISEITIEGKTFCITGNSLYNSRKEIVEMIEDHGGTAMNGVSSKTDYLLICDEKNSCWAFASYGRKVEKALQLQKSGKSKIEIVYEVDFYKQLEKPKTSQPVSDSFHAFAELLAIRFSNESELPNRLKNEPTKSKTNQNSAAEISFRQKVDSWKFIIANMRERIPSELVLRFISLNPSIEENTTQVTQVKDFLDFTDYLILKRDDEKCDDDELGLLSTLHTQFQKVIEKRISERK